MKGAALPMLLLAGCATVHDLDRRGPDARYVSQRSRDAVSGCIASAIARLGPVERQRREGATRLILRTQNGYPAALITVRTTSRGSNVSVRQTINYSLGSSVERCL
jgi:hypothetical protein